MQSQCTITSLLIEPRVKVVIRSTATQLESLFLKNNFGSGISRANREFKQKYSLCSVHEAIYPPNTQHFSTSTLHYIPE
jgi:hypothetical protein